MTDKELVKVASQTAAAMKKVKGNNDVPVNKEDLKALVQSAMAVSRIMKLAEKHAELNDPSSKQNSIEGEIWALILQELDEISRGK